MGCGASAKKYDGAKKPAVAPDPDVAPADAAPAAELPAPPKPRPAPKPVKEEEKPAEKKEPPPKVKKPLTAKEQEREALIKARIKAGGLDDARPCVCFHFRAETDMPGMFMIGKYNGEDDCEWFPEQRLPTSIASEENCTQLITFTGGGDGKDVFVGACFDAREHVGRLFLGKYDGDGGCTWSEPAVPGAIDPGDVCKHAVAINFHEGGKDAFLGLYFATQQAVGKLFFGTYNGEEQQCSWFQDNEMPKGITDLDPITQLVTFRSGKVGDEVLLGAYFDMKASGGKLFLGKYEGKGVCRWFDEEAKPPAAIDQSMKCNQLFAFNSGFNGGDTGFVAFFSSATGGNGKLYFGEYMPNNGSISWFEEVAKPPGVESGDVCTQICAFNAGEGGKEIVICAYFGVRLWFGKYVGAGSCNWFDERKSPSPNCCRSLYKEITPGPNGLLGYRCDGAIALQEIPVPGWCD